MTGAVVTLAIVNARVWTGDPRRPWADAVAIADARIVAVGSSAEVRKRTPGTARLVDAHGGMVVPGFIDAHVHFLTGGFGLTSVQLRDARTPEEFVSRLAQFASAHPVDAWVLQGDWDHELWGGELPTRAWIDAATPNHPVWINRLDGHMALANGVALKLAGVTAATADVDGGTIVRDAKGEPTGLLKDNAMALVARIIPPPSEVDEDLALRAAMAHVAAQGVTAVHHMGYTWDDLAVFERARALDTMGTRIYAAVPLATHARLQDHIATHGRGDAWLRVGLLKAFVDGSLGSHTAAMLEPYTDAPTERGLLVSDPAELLDGMRAAERGGLQVAIHAIGDRAIRAQLDRFAEVARAFGPRDRRWRLEHAQHVHPSDVPRFAELGVVASMQPYHAIDDGRWAERVVGPERVRQMYPWRSLQDSGATLAFGSDWFVAPPEPLGGIEAALTRCTLDGAHPDGWVPEQRVSLGDALRAYTAGAAYAGFAEHETGVLSRGRLADLVLLEQDLSRLPADQIGSVLVRMTIVGGRVVYDLG